MFSVVPIAIGLAMDCFAVCITIGFVMKNHGISTALKAPAFFSLFQMGMPIAGWFIGEGALSFISGIDHWVAFGLLVFVGCKMILESRKKESRSEADFLHISTLLTMSVATSIDALAIGLSFAFLRMPILVPGMVIGAVTLLLSVAGIHLGRRCGDFLGRKIGIIGGIILIGVGLRILLGHLLE